MRKAWNRKKVRMHLRKWRRSPLRMLRANLVALFWYAVDWVTAQWVAALIVLIFFICFLAAAYKLSSITPRSEDPMWDRLIETGNVSCEKK